MEVLAMKKRKASDAHAIKHSPHCKLCGESISGVRSFGTYMKKCSDIDSYYKSMVADLRDMVDEQAKEIARHHESILSLQDSINTLEDKLDVRMATDLALVEALGETAPDHYGGVPSKCPRKVML